MSYGHNCTIIQACWKVSEDEMTCVAGIAPGYWRSWHPDEIRNIDPQATPDPDEAHAFIVADHKSARAFVDGLVARCAVLQEMLISSFTPRSKSQGISPNHWSTK